MHLPCDRLVSVVVRRSGTLPPRRLSFLRHMRRDVDAFDSRTNS